MRIVGKGSVAGLLKASVDILLLVNLIVLVLLPLILQAIYAAPADPGSGSAIRRSFYNEIPKESYRFMLFFLYAAGILTASILLILRKILGNLACGVLLDRANAHAFRQEAYACFALTAAFIVKMLCYNSFLTIFCFFAFMVIALFSLVLSEVFRQAAAVKEENELTI